MENGKVWDIAVIGTGGIGGYYGARLAHAGHRVHFLLRSEYEYVKEHGLTVESVEGDFSIKQPLAYRNIEDIPPCDLVLVCVKTTANAGIFPTLAPLMRPGQSVVLLQNGFGYERMLKALYPDICIFAGMCFISTFRVGPGHIKHISYGKVSFAPENPADLARCREIAELFKASGVRREVLEDLALGRWKKLIWNIPYNGMSVTMDCKTDRMNEDPSLRKLVRDIMTEIIEAAAACGTAIDEAFAEEMLTNTDNMPPYEPSMRLDFLAKRPLEIEAIYGNPVALAAEHGYDMKYAKMIMRQLEAIESAY
jgi:2-dehydropantoate 2-reductase